MWAQRGVEFITDCASGTIKVFIRQKVQYSSDGNTELFGGEYAYSEELTPVVAEILKGKLCSIMASKAQAKPDKYKYFRDEQAIAEAKLSSVTLDATRKMRQKLNGTIHHIRTVWPSRG